MRAGADAVSLINTLPGMKIDVERMRPVLGLGFGGLSGPAVRPVGVACVAKAYLRLREQGLAAAVIGIGGIHTAKDALEYILGRRGTGPGRHGELRPPAGGGGSGARAGGVLPAQGHRTRFGPGGPGPRRTLHPISAQGSCPMIDPAELLALYQRYDAFLEGHFLLTSGLHSPHYFQCARILQHPQVAERLGRRAGRGAHPPAGGPAAVGGALPGDGRADHRPRAGPGPGLPGDLRRAPGGADDPAPLPARPRGGGRGGRGCGHHRRLAVRDRPAGGKFRRPGAGGGLPGRPQLGKGRRGAGAAGEPGPGRCPDFPPEDCPLCRQGLPLVKPGSRAAATGAA